MADRGRIGFVPPRYGEEVVGGSELVMRRVAHALERRGWDVEVLTTCAVDHYTWRNAYPAGTSEVEGVVVRRFPTVQSWVTLERDRIERRIQAGERPTADEQLLWVNGSFRVPDLYQYLLTHAGDYDALVYSPYLFWTTVVCAPIASERTVLIPCLHDEPYAYLDVIRPLLADAADVWFMSEPEHQLGHRLGAVAPRHAVTGEGIDQPTSYDVEGFRQRYGIRNPYLLFSGRREGGKLWDWLLEAYAAAVVRHRLPFDLVTTGVGPVNPPAAVANRVIDLGFVPDDDIGNVFAAASAYVQPSRNESFSRTIMEAWLAGTPVIANGESDVVTWHCERSGAGLTYHDWYEFAECLRFVAEAPDEAGKLAEAGRGYVLDNYTWDAAVDRMEARLEGLL